MGMLEWAKNEVAIASKREREKEEISLRVNGIMVVLAMIVL